MVDYNTEIGGSILRELKKGRTLRSVCKDEGMPDESSVREWIEQENHPFTPHYAEARRIGWHTMADECLEIADDSSNDWIKTKNGKVFNSDHYQRARLRLDTRKWLLSKCLPKIYGDKIETVHSGSIAFNNTQDDLAVLGRYGVDLTKLKEETIQ